MEKNIVIKGARVHNLKNVHVTIPHNQMVVVTGVSGSGKSSLTMDTLFAEGQRRYVESLSSYARQFMKSMDKPDVDSIEGMCPAIAIEQKVTAKTPRSTVGSMTEINDYLRLLFAKIGRTFSPVSGNQVQKDEVQDVVNFITNQKEGTKILLLIPFSPKSAIKEALENLLHNGLTRLYNKKEKSITRIEDLLQEEKKLKIENESFVLIDRLVVKTDWEEDELHRISDSVQTAFEETNGDVYVETNGDTVHHFCNRFELDGITFDEPTPNLFSSNNPYGACSTCEGFGSVLGIDPDLVIPDKNLSVYEGAVACWKGPTMEFYQKQFIMQSAENKFPIHKPINELTKDQIQLLWKGSRYVDGINSFFKMVEENLYKVQYRVLQSRYRGRTHCPECNGSRLCKEALYVQVDKSTIADINCLPAKYIQPWLENLTLSEADAEVAKRILFELKTRIGVLIDVGLGYLTMDRTANTLSGGESQRIKLTRIVGSNLTDSMYILDEPSIGLHARDTSNLLRVLKQLKDLGNTVIIVEHDEQVMKECDHIIDMGPLASIHGGEVIAEGHYKQIIKNKNSLTGSYLSGKQSVIVNDKKRKPSNKISLTKCNHHNLKNVDVTIPLNCLSVVTGVSGSGKTTLIKHILHPALSNALGDYSIKPGNFGKLTGDTKQITAVEMVDQNPIGKSSRSNPATYMGVYDLIRELYASQHLSKARGYKAGSFSFNVDGGRCDTCKGEGETIVEMQFLADVHILCESCKGKRFKDELLEITYREKNVYDILTMSVDKAMIHFADETKILAKLKCLSDVGLGYISLGQSSDTLSGGEAQRVKLASFLDKSSKGEKIFFIFDEPTTGLHFHDINKLLKSFTALIEKGHTILVIEHNTDVIKNADWIIDLGPEAGDEGGELVYCGVADGLAKAKNSITAKYL
jgi:excinuclease ABC subunit A